jgi:preprotein translocase subunit YajC
MDNVILISFPVVIIFGLFVLVVWLQDRKQSKTATKV